MKPGLPLLLLWTVALIGPVIWPLNAQTNSPSPAWTYRLLEGSYLIDDCLPCARPTIMQPMRGSFTLVLTEDNPLLARYELRDLSFVAASPGAMPYRLVGRGTWTIGGEVGVLQDMTLEVGLTDPSALTTNKVFTNDVRTIDRAWPIIDIHLEQTDANLFRFYSLHLLAAPLREIWFSTTAGFTAGKWQSPTNRVNAGDLISDSGRVVRSNGELIGRLGIMPGFTDRNIDAVDVAAGGEILFSLNQDNFSETLGVLHHGDLLTDRGAIFRSNQELMSAFAPADTSVDYGLDAVQVMTNGEIYFSIATNVVSQKIGMLFRGDLLSDHGRLVRSNPQLLSRFHPSVVDLDYGLDALYVWPGGEIWFSTEEGFNDNQLGQILSGDLLSDQGFVVFHNLELVSSFAPLEDVSEFGLDAIYIVTDATPPAPAPRMLSIQRSAESQAIALQWDGSGHVFQLEKGNALPGIFYPASPILPDLKWVDFGATQTNVAGFYRVRQW